MMFGSKAYKLNCTTKNYRLLPPTSMHIMTKACKHAPRHYTFPMCLHALPRRIWYAVHLPNKFVRILAERFLLYRTKFPIKHSCNTLPTINETLRVFYRVTSLRKKRSEIYYSTKGLLLPKNGACTP